MVALKPFYCFSYCDCSSYFSSWILTKTDFILVSIVVFSPPCQDVVRIWPCIYWDIYSTDPQHSVPFFLMTVHSFVGTEAAPVASNEEEAPTEGAAFRLPWKMWKNKELSKSTLKPLSFFFYIFDRWSGHKRCSCSRYCLFLRNFIAFVRNVQYKCWKRNKHTVLFMRGHMQSFLGFFRWNCSSSKPGNRGGNRRYGNTNNLCSVTNMKRTGRKEVTGIQSVSI